MGRKDSKHFDTGWLQENSHIVFGADIQDVLKSRADEFGYIVPADIAARQRELDDPAERFLARLKEVAIQSSGERRKLRDDSND